MKHAGLRLAVVGALVALALAGCGGGTKTGHVKTTNAPTNTAQTNGLENKSAAQCSWRPPRRSRPPRAST